MLLKYEFFPNASAPPLSFGNWGTFSVGQPTKKLKTSRVQFKKKYAVSLNKSNRQISQKGLFVHCFIEKIKKKIDFFSDSEMTRTQCFKRKPSPSTESRPKIRSESESEWLADPWSAPSHVRVSLLETWSVRDVCGPTTCTPARRRKLNTPICFSLNHKFI